MYPPTGERDSISDMIVVDHVARWPRKITVRGCTSVADKKNAQLLLSVGFRPVEVEIIKWARAPEKKNVAR